MQRFPSSLDTTSKIISFSLLALGAGLLVTGITRLFLSGDLGELAGLATGSIIVLGLSLAMFYQRPRAVVVTASGIGIDRKYKPFEIPFSAIRQIRIAAPNAMRGAIRTLGNGGLFGYTGHYYNSHLGHMTLYCSQRRNYVIIDTTDGTRSIVSPDDPGAFLEAVRQTYPWLAA